ncbi:MAG TPA: hypothetical protein VGX23_14755 [Actinocrinis sp.]|nr:hypothetical protein [Actinocrinis sp.]
MTVKKFAQAAVLAGAPVLALGFAATANAASTPAAPGSAHAPKACSRQLIGTVSSPEYLEASAPAAGKYTVEYDVTGTAYFDTYVNGTELGYVGGGTGTYHTRSFSLSAGGVLVQVAGPEGSGQAKVYLDQVC